MLPRWMDKLLSPNLWVLAATLSAVVGIGCIVAGWAGKSHLLLYTGIWLVAPLILGGAILALIVIPVLIVVNRKQKQPPM